jgi:N-acetylmuramic acid 6-phosphate (MurNAc-6-P) etherase
MTENITEITENLESSFNKLLKMNAELLKSLNDEQLKQVLPIQNDINNILNAVKGGDILAINEIQKKYASSNI